MAKRKAQKQQPQKLTPLEKLGLQVSSMIDAPKAQLERQVTIHRLDTDPDNVWEGVIDLLVETDSLEMTRNSDRTITLRGDRPADDDVPVDEGSSRRSKGAKPHPNGAAGQEMAWLQARLRECVKG